MAAPSKIEVLSDESSGATATVTTNSGTTQVDDIIVVVAADNYYTSYNDPSQPSGVTTWTHIVLSDNAGSGNRRKINAWWGKVTSGGAKVINVDPTSDEEVYLVVYVLRGAHLTSPIDATNTQADTSSGTTLVIPVVTTTVADTLVIAAACSGVSMSVSSPWAEDAEPTNAFGGMSVISHAKSGTGATSAANWTLSSSESGPSLTFAIKPSSVPSGTADVGIELVIEATGDAPIVGEGTSAPTVTLTVAATGSAAAQGTAAVAVEIAVAGTGDAPSLTAEGTADVGVSLDIYAFGASASRITPIRVLTAHEILVGNRNTRFYLDILGPDDDPLFRLNGVSDGRLDWVANAVVKGGGELTVTDVNQSINWLTARLKPWMQIEGLPVQPLGIFLPAEAPEDWGNGRTWHMKLLDKTTILDQDTIATTYALDIGTVVTTAIRSLIEGVGITNHSITNSTATVLYPMVWSPGTSKLRIINDLLASINYFSLYCNYDGQIVAEPYILPAARPIFYEFIDGPESIYDPKFSRDNDIWSIPNRVTLIGAGDGVTAALSSTVDNNDPLSPYSITNRGRVIGYTETGIEATSQANLDAAAKRKLVDLTSPTAGVEINHSPVPGLAVNMASRFRRQPANIDARHVISKTSITLKGKALATSTLREVVNV